MLRIGRDDPLHPCVETLWASPAIAAPAPREHSLPRGAMHISIRLDAPLRLYADADDRAGRTLPAAVVAGSRAGYCIKDTSTPTRSIGAMLRPGAAQALFGCSAGELEGRHVPLDLLWGAHADHLLERLQDAADPARQLELFAAFLRSRSRAVAGLHPQVVDALQALTRGCAVAGVAAASGHSHRHFITRFREAVGLSPKRYARVQRFQQALRGLAGHAALADLALAAGYSDQSHFNREFREMAGVSPRAYREARPGRAQHLPIFTPRSGGGTATIPGRRCGTRGNPVL